MMARKKRVLVTGASGFIGRQLTSLMVNQGFQVVGLVRRPPAQPLAGVNYLVRDVRDLTDLEHEFESVESVVHLAARAHGKGPSSDQSDEAFDSVNVSLSLNLAELAKKTGVSRFIFLSSIGVCGDETFGIPITEASPERPHVAYARSKLRAERALKSSLEGSATTLTIIRPALVYGVEAPGNFGKLLRICDSGFPLPFGGVTNRRTMVSVNSLAELLILCLEREEAKNEIFVAGDSQAISMEMLVRSLRKGMSRSPRVFPGVQCLIAVMFRLIGKKSMYTQLYRDLEVCSEKAVNYLGWRPEQDVERALSEIGLAYSHDQ